MPSISQELAEFVYNMRYEDLPHEVVHEAKRFLLDSFGCALAAIHNDDMKAMHRFTERLGGTQEATVIGSGLRTNCSNAALMNGLLIRALDYNDIYWEQDPSHPSDLLGAALASAEANGKSGRDLLLATVIAYELEMRWCHAAEPGIREVGWHHASLTQFVSPLVAGCLYDLDIEQLVAAVGISGSSHFTLGGVVAGHLTNMKNTADPLAAQAGVIAAMMAKEGYEGPVEVIEGKEGLTEVLSNVKWNLDELTKNLGTEYLITSCSYKAFPTEALTHQPISAALQLCREQKLSHKDVEKILVETTTRGADILSDPSKYQPDTKETADHSLPYVVAVAVVDGNVLPESFHDEKLHDPAIRELLPRIEVVADDEIDRLFPRTKRARVTITTTQDQSFTAETDFAKGSPQDPMTDEDVIAKFKANVSRALSASKSETLVDSIFNLDECEDVGALMPELISDLS
jgi:2-methylcitrate dehydratase